MVYIVVDTKLAIPVKHSIVTLCLFLPKRGAGPINKERVRSGTISSAFYVAFNRSFICCCLVSSRPTLLSSFPPPAGLLKRSVYMYFAQIPPRLRTQQYSYQLIIFSKFQRRWPSKKSVSYSKQYMFWQKTFLNIPFYISTIIIPWSVPYSNQYFSDNKLRVYKLFLYPWR